MEDTEFDCISTFRIDRYKHFEERLLTFENWPGKSNPVELAKAGFYFTEDMDSCRCAFCHMEIYKWEADDIPLMEHIKFNKKCPFARILYLSSKYKHIDNLSHCNIKSSSHNVFFYIVFILIVYVYSIILLNI